ncbi:hypothetical protein GQ53DRAFT_15984 [Thozetella sp. PMI_491]|nr:hypothetical protein GQ53DRAFT_15984 [Thozetella sp. PMI_491]
MQKRLFPALPLLSVGVCDVILEDVSDSAPSVHIISADLTRLLPLTVPPKRYLRAQPTNRTSPSAPSRHFHQGLPYASSIGLLLSLSTIWTRQETYRYLEKNVSSQLIQRHWPLSCLVTFIWPPTKGRHPSPRTQSSPPSQITTVGIPTLFAQRPIPARRGTRPEN